MLLISLLKETAEETYGEQVSHLDHALQSFASSFDKRLAGDGDATAVAAFWHDIGHSVEDTVRMRGPNGEDLGALDHETRAAAMMEGIIPPRFCTAIALHTQAKRYMAGRLASTQGVSAASLMTLQEQGGPMSVEQQITFEGHPCIMEALALRQADDVAKDPDFDYSVWGGRAELLLLAIQQTLRCALS